MRHLIGIFLLTGVLHASAQEPTQEAFVTAACTTQSHLEEFVRKYYIDIRQKPSALIAQINSDGGDCVYGYIAPEDKQYLSQTPAFRHPIRLSGVDGEAQVLKVKIIWWGLGGPPVQFIPPIERYILYTRGFPRA